MTENKEHKWNDMPLKSLEAELRRLPEVKVPEKLKTRILDAIPGRRQKVSIGHQLKWHLYTRDLVATAAAAIFIFSSMLMVSYGLPNPPQTLLTELNDTSLCHTGWEQNNLLYDQNSFLYDQNSSLIEDINYMNYNGQW